MDASYKLLGFEKGTGNKKYNALLQDKKTKQIKKIGFGASTGYNNIKIMY